VTKQLWAADYPLTDHPKFSLERKKQILDEWQTFIAGGFKAMYLLPGSELLDFLCYLAGSADWDCTDGPAGELFWQDIFDSHVGTLLEFMDSFSEYPRLVGIYCGPDAVWQREDGPIIGDLVQAMIEPMAVCVPKIEAVVFPYIAEQTSRTDVPHLQQIDFTSVAMTEALRERLRQAFAKPKRLIKQPMLFETVRKRLAAQGQQPIRIAAGKRQRERPANALSNPIPPAHIKKRDLPQRKGSVDE
jgi:hypothetical protein